MLKKRISSLKICFFMTTMFVICAHASTPFSQYGLIQNVQNYSNTPFYNPNTPIVNVPKIVYATGPALKPGDCERTVQTLVENTCAQQNNCKNTTLADVRPSIMIQLSNIPGYNYATSCAGYIDTIYENYIKQSQNINTVNVSTFPTAPTSTNQTNQTIPKWQVDYNDRANELKELQAQNAVDYTIVDTDFPKTVNDLSFQDSIALKKASYAPYQNAEVYKPMDIERTSPEEKQQKQMIECQKVYACIKNYGTLEAKAENAYFAAKEQALKQPKDQTLKQQYLDATKKVETAMFNAMYSPCTCTNGIANRNNYLTKMDVKCDSKFINDIKTTLKKYNKNNL